VVGPDLGLLPPALAAFLQTPRICPPGLSFALFHFLPVCVYVFCLLSVYLSSVFLSLSHTHSLSPPHTHTHFFLPFSPFLLLFFSLSAGSSCSNTSNPSYRSLVRALRFLPVYNPHILHATPDTRNSSSEYGTYKTVMSNFWPWLSGQSPEIPVMCCLFVRGGLSPALGTLLRAPQIRPSGPGVPRSQEPLPAKDSPMPRDLC
jgi:hypothetical protein